MDLPTENAAEIFSGNTKVGGYGGHRNVFVIVEPDIVQGVNNIVVEKEIGAGRAVGVTVGDRNVMVQ